MMQFMMMLPFGLMIISQQLGFSAAECNGIYFEMTDGVRRPFYPIDQCAQISLTGLVSSYQYTCVDVNGKWMGYKQLYSSSNCSGDVWGSEDVNASRSDWPINATEVYVQCEEDDCEYTVLRFSDSCNVSVDYHDEMFIVNECIEYDDVDKSEEWSCSEDGVTITYYDGDGCFGSGPENGTANMTDVYFNDSFINDHACVDVTDCDEWVMDCATEYSALCAYCAQYAPCINSIDPHCTNHEALGCLECKHYAECAVCAPGWDYGCIAMEFHLNDSCEYPDIVVNNQSISIPARMDGECHYNSIWEQYMTSDCKTGEFQMDCDENCTICGDNMTFTPSTGFDVQITEPMNAECFNYNETDDETNEIEYFSMFVYGHCTHRNMVCPDGNSCGPEACSTNTSSSNYDDYCIEIEVFDEDSTCTPEVGAGDYTAYAIADNTCRKDGSGRSYYALECAEGVFYGVIGCLDCLCSQNCTDIVLANKGADADHLDGYTPNTCYQYNITDNLSMAGIIDETLLQCSQSRTEITYQSWCHLTHEPTYDPTMEPTIPSMEPSFLPTVDPTRTTTINPTITPTVDPTMVPTFVPTRNPTVVPTEDPTESPSEVPSGCPSVVPTVQDSMETTVESETTSTSSSSSTSASTSKISTTTASNADHWKETSTTNDSAWIIVIDEWNASTMMTTEVTEEEPEGDYATKYALSLVGVLQMIMLSLILT